MITQAETLVQEPGYEPLFILIIKYEISKNNKKQIW
jgi:hypothetical protein